MNRCLCVCACAVIGITTTGCGTSGHREAQQYADQIMAMQAAFPGTSDSSGARNDLASGSYLRATINGQRWEATEMSPDVDRSSIIVVHGRNKNGFLTFNISGKRVKVGQPRTFKGTDPSCFWDENNETWQGTSGERVVTHIDEQWIDGTFHFTAQKNGQTLVCTDGEFRVPSNPRAMPVD
jgi:uncharacterized protein DUF6252